MRKGEREHFARALLLQGALGFFKSGARGRDIVYHDDASAADFLQIFARHFH